MKGLFKATSVLVTLALLSPIQAFAGSKDFSSTLKNKSKEKGGEEYYLVQDKIWAEQGCVADDGKKRLNPGESTSMNVKKDCKWGVVKYKVFSVKGDKDMGVLAHSFHDGVFYIEMMAPCKGSDCNFYDLSPQQDRKKS